MRAPRKRDARAGWQERAITNAKTANVRRTLRRLSPTETINADAPIWQEDEIAESHKRTLDHRRSRAARSVDNPARRADAEDSSPR